MLVVLQSFNFILTLLGFHSKSLPIAPLKITKCAAQIVWVIFANVSRYNMCPKICAQLVYLSLGLLVPRKRNPNAATYSRILDKSVLPALYQPFGDNPFLFQRRHR